MFKNQSLLKQNKILGEQKELVDTETEFFIRDKDNIDDFLYEVESSNLKREAANSFDQLDMVFITGDANARPWSNSMKKIMTLCRMCLAVNKYLYACSWGMQALVYICATNFDKEIQIINGEGNGGKLQDIHKLQKNTSFIKQSDFFLDNTTGDLYGYNSENKEWVLKNNVGMHDRRSALEYQSIGNMTLKAPSYKANTVHQDIYTLFKSIKSEETCKLKKTFMHHWALQGMPNEFIVPLKNSWDIHTFQFQNQERTFQVLAECNRGPLIIEIKSILATLFAINSKYPSTLNPIQNFILMALKNIKSAGQQQKASIITQNSLRRESTMTLILKKQKTNKKKKTLSLLNERIKKTGFQHSSNIQMDANNTKSQLSLSKINEELTHYKNSINTQNQVQQILPLQQSSTKNQFSTSKNSNVKSNFSNNPNNYHDQVQSQEKHNQHKKNSYISDPQKAIQRIGSSIDNELQINTIQINTEIQDEEEEKESKQLFNGVRRLITSNESYRNQMLKKLSDPTLSKVEVRKFLHPQISQDEIDITQSKLWVPGYYSQLGKRQNTHKRIQSDVVTLTSTTNSLFNKSKIESKQQGMIASFVRPGKTFGEFQSIFSNDPYLTQQELKRKQQISSDQNIIGGKSFKVCVSKEKQFTLIPPETATPLNFSKHQFRQELKQNWVGPQFTFY